MQMQGGVVYQPPIMAGGGVVYGNNYGNPYGQQVHNEEGGMVL